MSSLSVSVVQFINFFGVLDVSIILNTFPLPGRPINGLLAQVEPSFFIDLHAQQHCQYVRFVSSIFVMGLRDLSSFVNPEGPSIVGIGLARMDDVELVRLLE